MSKKVYGAIITEDYGLALPNANTQPTDLLVNKKEYDLAVDALHKVWPYVNSSAGREIIRKALIDLGEL